MFARRSVGWVSLRPLTAASSATATSIPASRVQPGRSQIRSVQLTIVCEATFSTCHALHHSHRDERSVSSVVPEMEAPGPSPDPPPGSGRGFFLYWASVGGDRINRRHVIIAAGLDAGSHRNSRRGAAQGIAFFIALVRRTLVRSAARAAPCPERHSSRSYGAAIHTFEAVERYVGTGRAGERSVAPKNSS